MEGSSASAKRYVWTVPCVDGDDSGRDLTMDRAYQVDEPSMTVGLLPRGMPFN
jgi:hypothetical protein